MSRTIYLAVFSNGARPAHWAIFIPTSGTEHTGKLIHVTGSTATGFYLEFKRNYDFVSTARRYQIVPLAQINDQYIADTVESGETRDTTARDLLESAATVVQPPGRSPNPFDPAALNCQDWIEDFIQKLIDDGYIASAATLVLQTAPRRL